MSYIKPLDFGETREDESKDCTVRALANCTMMEYDDAHEHMAYYGRPSRRGASPSTLMNAYLDAGLSKVQVFGTTRGAKYYARHYGHLVQTPEKGITLKNFCKKYNKGRYIVVYSGHALAVVNGQIIDKFNNSANKRVILAFSKPNT